MSTTHNHRKSLQILLMILCLLISFGAGGLTAKAIAHQRSQPEIYFLGDSRTVGMSHVIHPRTYHNPINDTIGHEHWIAHGGQGYDYLVNEAVPAMEQQGIYPGTKIFILMGVNDCHQDGKRTGNQYARLLNQKGMEWARKGAEVTFVSINPVFDQKSQYSRVRNQTIDLANQTIRSQLNPKIHYLDTNSRLSAVRNHAKETDSLGLHYHDSVYRMIYQSCLSGKPQTYSGFSGHDLQPHQKIQKDSQGRITSISLVLNGDQNLAYGSSKLTMDPPKEWQTHIPSGMIKQALVNLALGGTVDSSNQVLLAEACDQQIQKDQWNWVNYLHNTGNRISLKITLHYSQKQTLCSSLTYTARSLEDNGKGVHFQKTYENQ